MKAVPKARSRERQFTRSQQRSLKVSSSLFRMVVILSCLCCSDSRRKYMASLCKAAMLFCSSAQLPRQAETPTGRWHDCNCNSRAYHTGNVNGGNTSCFQSLFTLEAGILRSALLGMYWHVWYQRPGTAVHMYESHVNFRL